ncbi:DDHD domain-containing protein [Tricladium varicosporioides]|nr:DDHD domain-containing protein [Hymenoscyphus varicosporioides]
MSQIPHSYGPGCHLSRSVTFSSSNGSDDMPHLKAQFFYSSPLPIDDPLSAAPVSTDTKAAKHPLRPFSASDNYDLEEAWYMLGSKTDRKHHIRKSPRSTGKEPSSEGHDSKGKENPRTGKRSNKSDSGPEQEGDISGNAGEKKVASGSGPLPGHPTLETNTVEPPEPSEPSESSHAPKDKHSKRHAKAEAAKAAKAAREEKKRASSPSKGSKSKMVCKCKGTSHALCKNLPGTCPCTFCTKTSATSIGPDVKPSANQGEAWKDSCETGKSLNGGKLKSDKKSKGESDKGNPAGKEAKGNSYNDKCDDRHHAPMDDSRPKYCTTGNCVNMSGHDQKEHKYCIVDSPPQPQSGASAKLEKGKSAQRVVSIDGANDPCSNQSSNMAGIDRLDNKDQLSRVTKRELVETLHYLDREHRDFVKHKDELEKHLKHEHAGNPLGSEGETRKQKLKKKASMRSIKSNRSEGEKVKPDFDTEATSSSALNPSGNIGTTGQPFLKFMASKETQKPTSDGAENSGQPSDSQKSEDQDMQTETVHIHKCKASRNIRDSTDVPVGVSKLHLVRVPALQMHPIYWLPVHDVAPVTRGTWFYKDTMYPVESTVANQLETGYKELRPWSQTWSDELNSAIEVGAAGEEKIAHRLWPKEDDPKCITHENNPTHLPTDSYCAAKCFYGEAAAEGSVDLDDKLMEAKSFTKKYSNAQVIYKDSHLAFILKPNLQPSAYYGRKPLAKIKRGMNVGICVVRGFDWKAWEKLHPSKQKSNVLQKVEENAPVAINSESPPKSSCPACRAHEERPKITDLIFVIHGIGQKLSERVESFHFTHAINTFRRSVNVELQNDGVRRVLRKEMGGMMVLPVNWRSNVSFDEGGSMKDHDKDDDKLDFTLNDITPTTIPAVRSLISDVMLDIPFYMSHHKPKMIQAVIAEANRVYRLWCKNNPDFQDKGRVHIIAHSLGSAMAVEVLSRQPTSIPRFDINSKKMNTKHFDFNTTNLFCAGSPAGFFLLLERGSLLPRRYQDKPGAERSDSHDRNLTGEAGTFGCMAVDNVYNIMHYNDPIAYRLNAAVDRQFAANLKNAQVPNATTGFFESIGNAMRSITPGVSSSKELGVGQVAKAPTIARLPSQLEMEVHDFTREEIAEKKFALLNDNNQLDWFLSSGGGPLEIQYLNMLSAHSSYWGSLDFIRMIVTECGRKPGKNHSLPNMKAVKIGHKS